MTKAEEQQLIERLSDSQLRSDAFSLLIQTYQKPLYFYIRRMVIDHDDANDLVQDVFLKVWEKIDQFRGESLLSTWMYTIATRHCIDFLRKKSRWVSWESATPYAKHALANDPLYTGTEIRTKLDQAILLLPNKQRLVFNLHYFEEKKFNEIAQITGTSEGALKASYHHAVKKIEKAMLTP